MTTVIVDDSFISELNAEALSIEVPGKSELKLLETDTSGSSAESKKDGQLFVPVDSVALPELRALQPGKGLGEGTITAIIDTGVDANHPAIKDNLIYWADATQEGRVAVQEMPVDAQHRISMNGQAVPLPEALKNNSSVYIGVISEMLLGTQVSNAQKRQGKTGIDLDGNGTRDGLFPFIAGKDAAGTWVAFAQVQEDGDLLPVMDFNDSRELSRQGKTSPYPSLLAFPAVVNSPSYPLIFETHADKLAFLTVGLPGDHATHVAGIIAGHYQGLQGAAPQTLIESIRVCSTGWSCTTSNLVRGLIQAFYNPKNIKPDVVNISIGGLQAYESDVLDLLMRDLSAKFGAVFVLSAGNDGPGYHTINHLGAFGPTIMVGAHVSRRMMSDLYYLSPEVATPADMMFQFSSVGPSYSGELRPNIVAPGSALSSTSTLGDLVNVYQGTSMASPLVAGAVSAMLSLAKTQADTPFAHLEMARDTQIHSIISGQTVTESLSSLPFMIRAALEDTAKTLPGYTIAQQGHGLINAANAYAKMMQMAGETVRGGGPFFELAINQNQGDEKTRLFDRSPGIAPVKDIELSLVNDGAYSASSLFAMRSRPITVKQAGVEVQDTDGSVKTLTENLPITLSTHNPSATGDSVTLMINGGTKSGFESIRHLERMEPGKTYIARYDLYSNDQRIDTMVDFVQMPIALAEGPTTSYLTSIETTPTEKLAALAISNRPIEANRQHRYPIQVTAHDTQLAVSLGIAPDSKIGVLDVQVYNPDGELITEGVVGRSLELSTINYRASRTVVASTARPDGSVRAGTYEVIVSTSSSRRPAPCAYDLLIHAVRMLPSLDEVDLLSANAPTGTPDSLQKNPEENENQTNQSKGVPKVKNQKQGKKKERKSGQTVAAVLPGPRILTVENGDEKGISYALSPNFIRMEKLSFAVEPEHLSLRKIHVPPRLNEKADPLATDIKVSLELDPDQEEYRGRVDHHLYRIEADGKLVEAFTADANSPDLVFRHIPRPESLDKAQPGGDLYAAIESYDADTASAEVAAVVSYPGVPAAFEGAVELKMDEKDSTTGVSVLTITPPRGIIGASGAATAAERQPFAEGSVQLSPLSDSAVRVEIPVRVFQ